MKLSDCSPENGSLYKQYRTHLRQADNSKGSAAASKSAAAMLKEKGLEINDITRIYDMLHQHFKPSMHPYELAKFIIKGERLGFVNQWHIDVFKDACAICNLEEEHCRAIALEKITRRNVAMKYNASTDAAIAKRVQPDPSNPHAVYRVWTPSDMAFIALDVFINGYMEKQHIHEPGDESYTFWRGGLLDDHSYEPWQW